MSVSLCMHTAGKPLGSACQTDRGGQGAEAGDITANSSIPVPIATRTQTDRQTDRQTHTHGTMPVPIDLSTREKDAKTSGGVGGSTAVEEAPSTAPAAKGEHGGARKRVRGSSEFVGAAGEDVRRFPCNDTVGDDGTNERFRHAGQQLRDGCASGVSGEGGGGAGGGGGGGGERAGGGGGKGGGKGGIRGGVGAVVVQAASLHPNCSVCRTQVAMWGLEVLCTLMHTHAHTHIHAYMYYI